MLISFAVENWQSFREKTTLSMVASRERQHRDRVAKIDKYKLGLLPVSAIYGANASGKTKFFNALAFARQFVIKVTQPESNIPREYFKLDKECASKPSSFTFELFINDSCYSFYFAVTAKNVIEEKLVKILASSEKIIYYRKNNNIQFPDDPQLRSNQRLKFVAEGTRDNQLFLTKAIDQKIEIEYFQDIYEWFKHDLTLIDPNTHFLGLNQFFQNSVIGDLLSQLDTGISHTAAKDISLENLAIPEKIKTKIIEDLPDGAVAIIDFNDQIFLTKRDGEVAAKKLITYHKSFDGEDISFDFKDESHGTLRLMHLLPCFCDLWEKKSKKIYVIDELDRCLHTLLTRNLLEHYLNLYSAESRSQLLFTTHDTLLIDQSLLRRDEIWIAERDSKGCSGLISFGEYKNIRADKDIRKSYLQGRLGGVPKVFLSK